MTERKQNPREPMPALESTKGGPRFRHETEDMWPIFEQMVVDGFTNGEIAKKLGITRKTVGEWRKKYTTREPRRNATGQIVGTENDRITAECIRLYSAGQTYLQIAEQMGISYSTVRARLKKAYVAYVEKERDTFAARQFADLQAIKEELLPYIFKDYKEDLKELLNGVDGIDPDDNNAIAILVEKAFQKGRKNFDTKMIAMEKFLKYAEREAKLFGLDAASKVDINQAIKVDPVAIELLQKIEQHREIESNTVEAEVIEEIDLGNL